MNSDFLYRDIQTIHCLYIPIFYDFKAGENKFKIIANNLKNIMKAKMLYTVKIQNNKNYI